MKFGANIRGVTIAATICAMAAVGLAIGAGMFIAAILGAILILVTLTIMGKLERIVFKPKYYKWLRIDSSTSIPEDIGSISDKGKYHGYYDQSKVN